MSYKFKQSPNKSSRRGVAINAIILHFTASAALTGTVKWFMNTKARVSSHYVIGRHGDVVQMVKEKDKAWHAGRSELDGDKRVNSLSIGIEMVNWGELRKKRGKFYAWPGKYTREYDVEKFGKPVFANDRWWAPYSEEQFQACVKICRTLVKKYPSITVDRIVGHEDVAPGRKTDPGPAFDLPRLRKLVFIKETSINIDDDEIPEEELKARQADRAEPEETNWIARLWSRWRSRRSLHTD